MSTRVDIDVPEFTQADVIRITAVSAKTLQNWTDPNRGILRLSQGPVGKGRRRLYSPVDIMGVTLIAQLGALGIAPQIVSSLLYKEEGISDWIRAAAKDTDRHHVCRIFFNADGLYAQRITSDEDNRIFVRGGEDLTERRFAFVQVSMSDIAAFVLQGIWDIQIDETPEEELSDADKSIRAMRRHLNAKKGKNRQA